MDDLGRRRAQHESGQSTEPVRADDEQRVLLPLDLGDERVGGTAAHDLARRRSRRGFLAGTSERVRGRVALEVFVVVVRDTEAGPPTIAGATS